MAQDGVAVVSPGERAPQFGRLDPAVVLRGERFVDLATLGGVRVEHIVSSDSPDPAEQVQDWDEWVLVLAGSADLAVAGTVATLAAGDWVLLPAGTPHRVLRAERGTQWLAVHGTRDPAESAAADGSPQEKGGTR